MPPPGVSSSPLRRFSNFPRAEITAWSPKCSCGAIATLTPPTTGPSDLRASKRPRPREGAVLNETDLILVPSTGLRSSASAYAYLFDTLEELLEIAESHVEGGTLDSYIDSAGEIGRLASELG